MRVAVNTDGLYTTQAGVARSFRGLLAGFAAIQAPGVEILPLAWSVENLSATGSRPGPRRAALGALARTSGHDPVQVDGEGGAQA